MNEQVQGVKCFVFLKEAHESITRLEGKLAPILVEPSGEGDKAEADALTPLLVELNSVVSRLHQLYDRIVI